MRCEISRRSTVDGEFENTDCGDRVRRIYELTWKWKDPALTENYGIWLVKHDPALALKVRPASAVLPSDLLCSPSLPQLFTDPKQTLVFDTRNIFNKLSQIDNDVADRFLESAVIQERDTVSSQSALELEHVQLTSKRYSGLDAACRPRQTIYQAPRGAS